MRARFAYPLVFLFPSVVLAMIVATLGAAVGAGVLWLFVFGDGPWPAWTNAALTGLAGVLGFVALALLILVAHQVGKAREQRGGLCRTHLLVALGLSVVLPLLVLLQQWQVGNLGAPPPQGDSSKPTLLRDPARLGF